MVRIVRLAYLKANESDDMINWESLKTVQKYEMILTLKKY